MSERMHNTSVRVHEKSSSIGYGNGVPRILQTGSLVSIVLTLPDLQLKLPVTRHDLRHYPITALSLIDLAKNKSR